MGRQTRIGLGVLLILLGTVGLWPGVERLYGSWGGILGRVPLVPFVLMCGGLWLILRAPAKGTK